MVARVGESDGSCTGACDLQGTTANSRGCLPPTLGTDEGTCRSALHPTLPGLDGTSLRYSSGSSAIVQTLIQLSIQPHRLTMHALNCTIHSAPNGLNIYCLVLLHAARSPPPLGMGLYCHRSRAVRHQRNCAAHILGCSFHLESSREAKSVRHLITHHDT